MKRGIMRLPLDEIIAIRDQRFKPFLRRLPFPRWAYLHNVMFILMKYLKE